MPQERWSTREEIKYVYKLLIRKNDCSFTHSPGWLLYEPDGGGCQKFWKESLKDTELSLCKGSLNSFSLPKRF